MLLNIKQYAKKRRVSETAVKKACRKGKKLVGVQSYQKVGGTWILEVEDEEVKKNRGKCIVVSKKKPKLVT